MNNLAIIPARCGSKGLKDKNIKLLCGVPLLVYSIKAALDSGEFDKVMVSTDSLLYSQIAKENGAEVPFLRDETNSSDTASSWDVVREVLSKYIDMGIEFETVALLQPTSPLRTYEDICNAYELYYEKSAGAIVSVCESEHSPLWCNKLPESLCMNGFLNNETMRQRQQLDKYYRLNGSIYIVDVKRFLNSGIIYDSHCFAYVMPKERSVDIDSELDFLIAETIINYSGSSENYGK